MRRLPTIWRRKATTAFCGPTLKSEDAAYQKAYLFRIATNLARDHWRRLPHQEQRESADPEQVPADDRTAEHVQQRSDLGRAMGRMKPREREILWLAYAEGASHKEIAEVLGLRAASVRLLLFRARQKMLKLHPSASGGIDRAIDTAIVRKGWQAHEASTM